MMAALELLPPDIDLRRSCIGCRSFANISSRRRATPFCLSASMSNTIPTVQDLALKRKNRLALAVLPNIGKRLKLIVGSAETVRQVRAVEVNNKRAVAKPGPF